MRMCRGLEGVTLLRHAVGGVFDGTRALHLIERYVRDGIGAGEIRDSGDARRMAGAKAAQAQPDRYSTIHAQQASRRDARALCGDDVKCGVQDQRSRRIGRKAKVRFRPAPE